MKVLLVYAIAAVLLISCSGPATSSLPCEKYDAMILGVWVNKKDSNLIIHISPVSIVMFSDLDEPDTTEYEFVNNTVRCEDPIANYPPSQLQIKEVSAAGDTLIHHIISIDEDNMEWASGSHDVHWRRAKRCGSSL